MARRSIERTFVDVVLSGFGLGLVAIALLIMLVREYPVQLLVFSVVALGSRHCWNLTQQKKRASDLECAVRSADRQIEQHRNALIAYYRQSVRRDQFGNEDTHVWQRWIATFVDSQVRPELTKLRVTVNEDLLDRLRTHVDGRVRNILQQDHLANLIEQASDTLTPEEYERNCASSLFRRGWTVHPTPATGDHGADVIAEKGGKRLVVQCKLYSQPVGNKAVQEAYSALRLYNGTHACVVAPNGFTAQAERAAHGLSVRLLHHSQLEAFAEELTVDAPAFDPLLAFQRPQLESVDKFESKAEGSRRT